jgi:hypothetical protein
MAGESNSKGGNIVKLAFWILFATATVLVAEPQFGKILEKLGSKPSESGNDKIVAGLKEALQIGTANAVNLTGKPDGFFANQTIKILLPEKIKSMEKGLRLVGMGRKLDEFELSMNRAAEKAAPAARGIFADAIKSMTLDDGRKILTGGDTAATQYFQAKTSESLAAAFRPVIGKAMEEVGVTNQYQQLTKSMNALPLGKKDAFDLDTYVVSKSLNGLFHMLGEEERKIRTNPAARVTSLLKDVFGK